ncbi:hypothetical protein HEK616_79440 (plasmid) [Streptomyces nigrescens]|uniref:Uncharacterized protein n=1 Tax=Streptomyces nigrescens TaxID=1920 RepID=A0ABM8A746_STRNI|nr:hypothetical protein [Streptomyces nigrescens]BDM74457.1 hypothetical protein HEK616_79440 [Streptomyces nigrescens]
MLVKGFENAPLVAGEELLALPGFWAGYLMWLSQTQEYDPVPEWFGVDGADADAACDALCDEDRWPVFRIPFAGGHTAVVLGYNLPDDPGTEYFISHPEWDVHGRLATVGGHQAGPGLSWQELAHIARTPDLDAPGVHAEHARFLLLLPALGDQDLPEDATDILREVLAQAGLPETLAEALLADHPLWEPAQWTLPSASPLSGSQAPFPGILECDGPASPRCGTRLAQGIARDQSDRLAYALGTWPTV